jgi:hypothetical protein
VSDPQDRLGAAAGADMLGRQMLRFNAALIAVLIGAWIWAATFNGWWPF